MVPTDRRIRILQIEEELKISKERIEGILHNRLHMNKISARWPPKILTPLDKQQRVETLREFFRNVRRRFEWYLSSYYDL